MNSTNYHSVSEKETSLLNDTKLDLGLIIGRNVKRGETQILVGGMGLQPLREKAKFGEAQIIWHRCKDNNNIY